MIKNYFTVAYRYLMRYKVYSLINIIGFSIALVPVLLTILYVNYEFSYDKFNKDYKNIYRVTLNQEGGRFASQTPMTPAPLAEAMKAEFPEIQSVTRMFFSPGYILVNNEKFLERNILYADPSVFQVFTFEMLKGDAAKAISDQSSILLSESMAKKYFGNLNPLGKAIMFKNGDEMIVKGVYKDFPGNSHFNPGFVMNISKTIGMKTAFGANVTPWGFWRVFTYFKLKEKCPINQLQEKLADMFTKHATSFDHRVSFILQPLTDIHLNSKLVPEISTNGSKETIYLYISIASILFLIAIINYVNLSTARSSLRTKEIGIRKIAGARKSQLVLQFLSETVLITLCSLIVSLFIINLILPSFNRFVDRDIPSGALFNLDFILCTTGFILLTSLAAGIYHAFILSSVSPLSLFKGELGVSNKYRFRNALLAVQFIITIVFVFIIFTVKKQLDYVSNTDLGYEKDNIIVFELEYGTNQSKADLIKNEIMTNPDIVSSSACKWLPNESGINRNENLSTYDTYLLNKIVDYDYIDFFNIKMAEGRKLDRTIVSDVNSSVIINETAAKFLTSKDPAYKDPIGKEITHNDPSGISKKTIIGVMKDYHNSMHEKITPIYLMVGENSIYYRLCVKIKPGREKETIGYLKNTLAKFQPGEPFKYDFFSDIIKSAYKSDYKDRSLFLMLFIFTAAIVCMGLIGFVSFATDRRRKEIGIRKVLGADSAAIVYMFTKQYGKSVLLSNVFALPLGYFLMKQWLNDYAYHIDFEIRLFIVPGIITLSFVLVTVCLQSVKAALANPVESLRNE